MTRYRKRMVWLPHELHERLVAAVGVERADWPRCAVDVALATAVEEYLLTLDGALFTSEGEQ